MKLLWSLLVLLAVVIGVMWFGYNIPPQEACKKIINIFASPVIKTEETIEDVGGAVARFSEVIKNNYNHQDMTEPASY